MLFRSGVGVFRLFRTIGRKSYAAGTATTTEGITLGKDMTFGSLSQSPFPGGFIPYGGNFYASNYTISLWLNTSSLTEGTQTTLFGYYGTSAGQSYGANALYLTADASLAWEMEI